MCLILVRLFLFFLNFFLVSLLHTTSTTMLRKRVIDTGSTTDLIKEEIIQMSYELARLMLKNSAYRAHHVLKVFDEFSNAEKSKFSLKSTVATSEKRKSFLANLDAD